MTRAANLSRDLERPVGETSDMCGQCADGEHVNPYAPGSVWHTSWGYDQTNVEFYTVVRETKASVWLVPMGQEHRDGRAWPTEPAQWSTDPELAPVPKMHRKGKHGTYLRLDYVRHAWPYEGKGCYSTRAAGQTGH